MKRMILNIAVASILLNVTCSKPTENNSPIIGAWSNKGATKLNATKTESNKQEWIFNDAYLGRYNNYSNQELIFKTDFKWEYKNELYTISYPGTDLPTNTVHIERKTENIILLNERDEIFATKK
ncbi:MAG: hypothetical protein V3U92_02870 [Cellulophaga sp.]